MRIITALLFLFVLAGCAHRGEQMDKDSLSRIVPGVTTRAEMVQMFGNPLSQSFGTEGKLSMIWFYVHVGPFGTNMKQQNLTVLFDRQDRVERFSLIDEVSKQPVNVASPPVAPPPASAPTQPMTEQSYKDAQIQQLMQKNLPYDEYQKQYRAIMDR